MALQQTVERFSWWATGDDNPGKVETAVVQRLTISGDAIDLAERCQRLADNLVEPQTLAHPLPVLHQLADTLTDLAPALDEPLSSAHIHQLNSVGQSARPVFVEESETLRDYCAVITGLLTSEWLEPEENSTLTGLLYDLLHYMADDIRAPREMLAKAA